MTSLSRLLDRIGASDEAAASAAQRHLDRLTKPPGSLGRLEELAVRLASVRGVAPSVDRPVIFTFAADHGVALEGVSAFPQIVTAQMVENFVRGGAAVNVLARQAGARVVVADFGLATPTSSSAGLVSCPLGRGTANMTRGPAMTRAQAVTAIMAGARLAEQAVAEGADLLATGEMGIANTTAASAITACVTAAPPSAVTGRGTGVDDAAWERKLAAVRRALEVNGPDPRDGLDVLAKVGGFEIGGLVGVILAGAAQRIPVALDGFIAGAAALVAAALAPSVRYALFAAHRSAEPGHARILAHLGLVPYLELQMRLGEGTGAALFIHLARAAARVYGEMATFKSAGVSESEEATHSGSPRRSARLGFALRAPSEASPLGQDCPGKAGGSINVGGSGRPRHPHLGAGEAGARRGAATTRALVVAGVASGVGKTTVTLGLLEAYRRRGLTVQAFKVGPDFIDPAFHALITDRPSYNLDGWMCGRDHVVATVTRHAAGADLVIIEGVMGCFDGIDGTSEDGSTAQVAKWLGAPVMLVVDVGAQSRSAAALVQGFEDFDPALTIAGVIANGVGGETHARWVSEAIAGACRAVPLGALRRDVALGLPERHLGLVTAAEGPLTPERRQRLADAVEAGVDLDRLLTLASPLSDLEAVSPDRAAASPRSHRAREGEGRRARIGVARDAAFQFYYAENLEALRAAGAELVFWSPLTANAPPEVDGLYFGGGYPELHARALADNAAVVQAVADFAASGRPVYAECGGLMFLAETLEDLQGIRHRMAGVLPGNVQCRPGHLSLGYTEVTFVADTPLGPAGTVARGHEFHISTLSSVPAVVPRAYRLAGRHGEARAEGYLLGHTLVSYIHLHFGSNPALASALVGACARR